jgi:hypothetical protein
VGSHGQKTKLLIILNLQAKESSDHVLLEGDWTIRRRTIRRRTVRRGLFVAIV